MKIEKIPFINRQSELASLRKRAGAIAQGRGEDLLLTSPAGWGKTALLQELKRGLFWEQEEVIPVYFSFSRDFMDPLDFAEEYLVSLLSQILLFGQKKRIYQVGDSLPTFSLLRLEAERQGDQIISGVIQAHQKAQKDGQPLKGLSNALKFPHRVAQAREKPIWIMVDHFQGMEALTWNGRGLIGFWREALSSPWAPHLFAGEPPGFLFKNFLPFMGPPDLPVWELTALSAESGLEMARVLGKTYEVSLSEDLIRSWFEYLGNNPGLLSLLIREAGIEASSLDSPGQILQVYLKSLAGGGLGRFFQNRLHSLLNNSPQAYFFIRVLHSLWRSKEKVATIQQVSEDLNLAPQNLQRGVAFLEAAGVVWERFGSIGLESTPVLHDWIEFILRKYLHQEDEQRIMEFLTRRIEARFSTQEGPSLPEAAKVDDEVLNFSLVIPSNSESERVAVRALEQIATHTDLDADSLEQVKAALMEACLEAGAHSQNQDKKITLHFTLRPEQIEIVVEDRGDAFDPVVIQSRMIREEDSFSQKRGRGLTFIQEMMDDVRLETMETGTRLYMIKRKENKNY